MSGPRDAVVVGIAQSAFARDLGTPERTLALQVTLAALQDAGLAADAVDGLVRFDIENTSEVEIARNLGIPNLRFFAETGYGGGGGCAALGLAALAVEAGRADTVVCWRARNRGSGGRPWAATGRGVGGEFQFSAPYGLVRPVDQIAMIARRHMHEFGTTEAHLGAVAVACRRHASRNPAASLREPITLADHADSRYIAEPLRKLDCCLESDGALALVMTTRERARDLPTAPVQVLACAQGTGPEHVVMTNYYAPEFLRSPSADTARDLFGRAGVAPADIDVAQIYDAFTPLVILGLEDYGFCKPGEGGAFAEGGRLEWPDGELPVNTSGGGLSEAYVHGFNLLVEGVRQIRGESPCQVAGAELCLVTSGAGVPTSAAILARA